MKELVSTVELHTVKVGLIQRHSLQIFGQSLLKCWTYASTLLTLVIINVSDKEVQLLFVFIHFIIYAKIIIQTTVRVIYNFTMNSVFKLQTPPLRLFTFLLTEKRYESCTNINHIQYHGVFIKILRIIEVD